ncbi:peptidase [Escherichia coli]
MNLFDRLLNRRLCNEQPDDGGAAPAPSEPAPAAPAPTAEPTQPEGDKPQPAAEGENPAGPENPEAEKDGEKDKPKDEKDKKPEGAPEKYEFKPAEGQELDSAALEQFEPIARELNLSNEQAQKMVDLYGTKILPMVQQQQAEAWQKTTEQWAADVKADKEIGGANLTSNISVAQRALDTFGSPELKEYLTASGLGNHPELVKAFVKVGKAMSEDGMVTGKEAGQRSAAEVLYGN